MPSASADLRGGFARCGGFARVRGFARCGGFARERRIRPGAADSPGSGGFARERRIRPVRRIRPGAAERGGERRWTERAPGLLARNCSFSVPGVIPPSGEASTLTTSRIAKCGTF